jgi:hypothetical protein
VVVAITAALQRGRFDYSSGRIGTGLEERLRPQPAAMGHPAASVAWLAKPTRRLGAVPPGGLAGLLGWTHRVDPAHTWYGREHRDPASARSKFMPNGRPSTAEGTAEEALMTFKPQRAPPTPEVAGRLRQVGTSMLATQLYRHGFRQRMPIGRSSATSRTLPIRSAGTRSTVDIPGATSRDLGATPTRVSFGLLAARLPPVETKRQIEENLREREQANVAP